MPRLVISSCGISILANQANQEIKNLLLRNANRCENEIYGPEKATIDGFLTGCQTRFKAERFASSQDLCAELNSILTYYKGDISDSQADTHYLIHTDTYLGERAAALVQAQLLQHFRSCQLQKFHKLRVNSIIDFQHGFAELIKWCEQTLPSFRQKQVKVVFNLSGGFKSIQAGFKRSACSMRMRSFTFLNPTQRCYESLEFQSRSISPPFKSSVNIWLSFLGSLARERAIPATVRWIFRNRSSSIWTMLPSSRRGQNCSGRIVKRTSIEKLCILHLCHTFY